MHLVHLKVVQLMLDFPKLENNLKLNLKNLLNQKPVLQKVNNIKYFKSFSDCLKGPGSSKTQLTYKRSCAKAFLVTADSSSKSCESRKTPLLCTTLEGRGGTPFKMEYFHIWTFQIPIAISSSLD